MEGAEAKVYRERLLGIDAVVKDRVRKAYRNEELDREIREERTKKEARIMALASRGGAAVPMLLMVRGNAIVMTYIKGELLSSMLSSAHRRNLGDIFVQAGGLLAKLHSLGINHGDYTPANLLVDGSGVVWAIDFGLSDTGNSDEEFALDLLLMKRSVKKREYVQFLNQYVEKSGSSGSAVIKRLKEIEMRGRYQSRSLLTA